jgi:hypothetical protein
MRDTKMKEPDSEELEDCEEWFQKQVEAMPIEKRLAGRTLEQVLGVFTPAQLLPLLPLELLRAFREDYLRTLPADAQEKVRKRLHGGAP